MNQAFCSIKEKRHEGTIVTNVSLYKDISIEFVQSQPTDFLAKAMIYFEISMMVEMIDMSDDVFVSNFHTRGALLPYMVSNGS
jgi:hypothetical protein